MPLSKFVRQLLQAFPIGETDPPPARVGRDRASAKHIPYFKLREALESPGCAICRVAEDAVHAYQRSLLYENVNDPGVRARIARSRGFCHEHAWGLVEHRDLLGTAIVHRDLLAQFRNELPSTASRGARRDSPRWASCPACVARDHTAGDTLLVLRDSFNEAELLERFNASDGLCRHHFELACQAWTPPVDAFVEAQAACLTRLSQQLDELIRKQDYRFSSEPIGKERNSWLRAIAVISGLDGDMLPRSTSTTLPPTKDQSAWARNDK